MTPIFQTRFSSPGVHGNCFLACVSSITGIPLEVIDHIDGSKQNWFQLLYPILWDNGFSYVGTLTKDEEILSYTPGIDGYYIIGGESPRGVPAGHAVVFKEGLMVHDPHPDGTGILSLDCAYMIERREWME